MASITTSTLPSTQLHSTTRKQTISLPTKPSTTATTNSCESMDRLCPKPTVERGQLGPVPNKPSIATECAVRLDACRARLAMTYRVSISKPSAIIPVIRARHERVKEPDTTPSPRRRACSFFVARPSCLSHVICQPEEMTESRLRLAPRKRSDPDLRIKCLREHTKLIRAQKAKERAEKKALKEKERRREREQEREKKLKATKKWTPVTVQTTSAAAVSAIAFPSIPEPEAPAVVQPAPPASSPIPAPVPVPTVAVHPAPEEKTLAAQSPPSIVTSPSSTVTAELDDLSLDWKKEKKEKMMRKKSAEALAKGDNEKEKSGHQSLTLEIPTETPARKRKTSGAERESGGSSLASTSSPTLEVPGETPVRKRKTSGLDKKTSIGTDRERKKSKPKLPTIPSSTPTEVPPLLPTSEPSAPRPPASKPDTPKTPEKKCIIIVNRPPCIIVPLPESMPAVMARPDSPTPRK